MGTHPIFESDFDCLTERERFLERVNLTQNRETNCRTERETQKERLNMYLSTWEEFTRAADKLEAKSGEKCRTTFKYRHCDQKLVVTFTDNHVRLQFAAEYSNDVKRLEKFLTSKMRMYCDVEE